MSSFPSELGRFLLQVVVILGASRLLARAGRRLGQPTVVAEIVAGVVLGPSLFGWIAPDAYAWVFPSGSFAGLRLLSQLGLVLFMFLVGLELDVDRLRGRTHASVLVGAASLLVPLALGLGVASPLHARYGEGAPLLPFALFLAAAVSVTAFPVLARILSERHLLDTRVGTIAIAAAAVDDLTAWCLVTLLVTVVREDAWLDGARVIVLAIAFVVAMVAWLRPRLARTVRRLERGGAVGPSSTVGILIALLAVAATSELLGVHALFGAFLFGAILPKDGPLADALHESLDTLTTGVLLPLFFAYSGVRTQLALLDQQADWIATAVIVVVATAGKLGGSALASRWTGLSWREAGAVGVLLNTRGLMGLIVLNVGLDLGVITPTLFAMLVFMALVTTLLTSPVLRLLHPDRRAIEERFAERVTPTASAPPSAPGEVVVACVLDPTSGPALASAAHALAGDRGRVFGLHLEDPDDRRAADQSSPADAGEPAALAPFLAQARALMLEARPLAFVSTSPGDDIVRIADAKRASTILLGAHHPWLLEGRLDGVVRDVLRHAEGVVGVLVGVDRAVPREGFARILVADGGSPEDRVALDVARRLSSRPGARVTVLEVGSPQAMRVRRSEARGGWMVEAGEGASPVEAVVRAAASRRFDLVVVALAKRWNVGAARLAERESLAAKVAVPLLVVHAHDAESVEAEEAEEERS